MALPTITRTWQFKNNIAITAAGVMDTHRRVFWEIKNALTTFGTNPWVCVASATPTTCLRYGVDSLGPPGPAYDTWGATFDSSKIHFRRPDGYNSYDGTNSGKHSWIVLRNTQLDTTYDMCIDLYTGFNDSTAGVIRFFRMMICRNYNLTGSGSITARPSAVSGWAEADLRNGNQDSYGGLGGNTSWDANYRLHVHLSTDGLGTRIMLCAGHCLTGFYAFDRIVGAPAGLTNPVWAVGRGDYTLWISNTYGWLHDTPSQQYDVSSGNGLPGNWLRFYLTSEGFGGSAVAEAYSTWNEVSGKWPLSPCGIACDYGPLRGKLGYVKDLWWGSQNHRFNTFPNDGTRQYAQMGHLVYPWDGGNLYTT
jgi:hypothetical protein